MDATIVIPTKNGGEQLDEVLHKVFQQKTGYSYEVICVDSGSTDNTIETIKRYPCKLFEIRPEEFGHGRTRNYGAAQGSGEFILFLTQDAVPYDEHWLQNFLDAMKLDEEIAGGFGKHYPYPGCNVLDERDLKLHFQGFGDTTTIYCLDDAERYRTEEGYRHFLAFFSDNNSCLRRSVWEEIPYEDVNFSEDQIWAKKIIELGYKKVYCPEAAVYHSHNYELKTYFKRYYDEYKGLYRVHGYKMFHSVLRMCGSIVKTTINDLKYIWKAENGIDNKMYWSHYAISRDRKRCLAGYLAGNYVQYPKVIQDYLDTHISQQYNQIHDGSEERELEKKMDMKELLKWIFIKPELIDKTGKINVDRQVDRNKIDISGFYSFVLKKKEIPFKMEEYLQAKEGPIILNWIIPEMGIGSGGHINIFRFVSHLQKMGFQNRIYLSQKVNLHTDAALRDFLRTYYDLDVEQIEVHVDIQKMKFAHGTIATAWNTAYNLRDFNNTISKFYFVQDFEPLFFPVGSDYIFAENTYKMGFRGITAGDWLKNKLHDEYGMQTESFLFSYDHDLYQPGTKRDDQKRIFFYARPVTPRRDFELGLLALECVTKEMPEVEIVFAGWDVSGYNIPFKHQNLGSVKLDKLSDLYAQCDLCLVLSNTNLSLLPLEIMASNSVAVCTVGDNSSWLVNEENSVMVGFEPNEIAETLVYYLKNPDELEKIRNKGLEFAQGTSWEREAEKVKKAIIKGIEEDEKNIDIRG